MSIQIITYGRFREGREKIINLEHFNEMTLGSVTNILGIDPYSVGIVKINELTGPISDSLNEKVPDGSCVQFLPFLAGG